MFETTFYVILMILGFGLLIFVHELGHFLAAKWAGIRTEAFAIGMGPVIAAWRKGVGFALGSTHHKVVRKTGKAAMHLTDQELAKHGIGETEYSLRWLPFGGFVRMLGQDDIDPSAVSDAPRSYNKCPIGKRMIVVSAGVIMNLLLAAVLYVVVFMVGVRFEAPIIGQIAPTGPAAIAGIQPGDRVTHINGRKAQTFADIQIAGAMSRPDVPVHMTIQRPGHDQPLEFEVEPAHDRALGLRGIAVAPAYTLQLIARDPSGHLSAMLQAASLAQQGVEPVMTLIAANGQQIGTFQQFQTIVEQSRGQEITTHWQGNGKDITATITPKPQLDILLYPHAAPDAIQNFELGLLGLTPLVALDVPEGTPNAGILRDGDIVLQVGSLHGPTQAAFRDYVIKSPAGDLPMRVLRNGQELDVVAKVSRRGAFDERGILNVLPRYAMDLPYTAAPLQQVLVRGSGEEPSIINTPVHSLQLFPATRIDAVNGTTISDWPQLRAALRKHTKDALHAGSGAEINLAITHPTPGHESQTVTLTLSPEDVASLHALSWSSGLSEAMFEPLQVVLSAGGNPLTALRMGAEETWKMTQQTYLTIDRLLRRTVGVDQLRGPVGIVHVGVTIADRGLLYLVFLLAVISVNLAVLNFLPLPIVDGGLFLFLVYEKIKGRPPSLAFQNFATILGFLLIGTLFVVVTYNDIARLFS